MSLECGIADSNDFKWSVPFHEKSQYSVFLERSENGVKSPHVDVCWTLGRSVRLPQRWLLWLECLPPTQCLPIDTYKLRGQPLHTTLPDHTPLEGSVDSVERCSGFGESERRHSPIVGA